MGSRKPPGRRLTLDSSQRGASEASKVPAQSRRRVNTAGKGEGRRGEGNGREGLERQLGELKYADGEMCECLGERKDPDPKE